MLACALLQLMPHWLRGKGQGVGVEQPRTRPGLKAAQRALHSLVRLPASPLRAYSLQLFASVSMAHSVQPSASVSARMADPYATHAPAGGHKQGETQAQLCQCRIRRGPGWVGPVGRRTALLAPSPQIDGVRDSERDRSRCNT